tara:strand:- start:428 stop:1102 length:675 start_codon:yes stop_codon:yes gene_type:complete
MQMKKIIIFGGGGHAKIVQDCIKLIKNFKVIGFIDEKNYNSTITKKMKYLGTTNNLNKIVKGQSLKNLMGVVAIGSNITRKEVVLEVNKINKHFKWSNIIHPSAIISNTAKIGDGNMFLAGSIICSDAKIDNHVSINTGTHLDHDNIFSDFSSTGPGVATGGNVKVGKLSFLGIGATIKHNVSIGNNTVIGGQSFVNKNCNSDSLYYGVPAKRIKQRNLYDDYL